MAWNGNGQYEQTIYENPQKAMSKRMFSGRKTKLY